MRRKYTLFCLLLLGLSLFPAISPTKNISDEFSNTGQFVQKKCTQRENLHINCKDVQEGTKESQWPTGTYALPMSRYGCPESYVQGWREGHISLTWRRPRAVYLEYLNKNHERIVIDLTNVPFDGRRSMIFGKVTRDSFTIHFCYKYRKELLLDVGVWPDGNFSIYGTNNSCPDGFESYLWDITIPEVSRWTKYGYTPDLEILNGNQTTVKMRICTKTSAASAMNDILSPVNKDSNGQVGVTGWNEKLSHFLLIKNHNGESCTTLEDTELTEETLYIEQDWEKLHTRNSTNRIKFQTSCFYETDRYSNLNEDDVHQLRENRFFKAYSVYISNVTHGFISGAFRNKADFTANVLKDTVSTSRDIIVHLGKSDLVSALAHRVDKAFTKSIANLTSGRTLADEIKFMEGFLKAYRSFLSNVTNGLARPVNFADKAKFTVNMYDDIVTPFRDVIVWTIVDLARSVPVSAVGLQINEDLQRIIKYIDIVKYMNIVCKTGSDKWTWLYSDVISCLFFPFYDTLNGTLELLFLRDIEGRFISLFEEFGVLNMHVDVSSIDVFTKRVNFDSSVSCNMDLGMSGLEIRDDSISASSWLDGYPPGHSRPYSSGWCADGSDEEPYIQVDFPTLTVIEGITIYNWKSVILFNRTMLQQKFASLGVHTFNVTYPVGNQSSLYIGSDNFFIDTSKSLTLPQTFWFTKQIEADSVRIFILQSLTEGLSCLRFELHGCKKAGEYKLVNRMTQLRHNDYEVAAFVNEMFDGGMRVSSLGYPVRHGGQTYIWLVNLPKQHFIKLRFHDISLGYYQDALSPCNDTITISTDLHDNGRERVIDYRFVIEEEHTLSVDTSVSSIVMSLSTCTSISQSSDTRGFTALLKSDHVPTCFSLQETIPWHLGLKETCTQPAMILTSMSYLGLPFRETTEEWTIHVPVHQIHLQIFQFNVLCQPDYSLSHFKIIDLDKESTYCNFDRPPDLINSTYDKLQIIFYKAKDYKYNWDIGLGITQVRSEIMEGFRMVYTSSREKMDYLINYRKLYSEVRNIALGKPAIMSSIDLEFRLGIDPQASKAADGLIHQELRDGSCFLTSYEYEPWWMVDLQGVYILEHVVLFKRLDCCVIQDRKNYYGVPDDSEIANVQISVGRSVNKLYNSGYICGYLRKIETIDQSKIIARYVRITVLHLWTRFSICEVQIYGQNGKEDSVRKEEQFLFPRKVHGNWGDWTSWGNICYCNGTRIRRRECNNPRPDYGGTPCTGKEFSVQSCENEFNCTRSERDPKTLTLVKNLDISIGMTTCDMKAQDLICIGQYELEKGITVPLLGIKGRFVKLQTVGQTNQLELCEVEIYGQEAGDVTIDKNIECSQTRRVDGGFTSWSDWSSCSRECGNGIKSRARTCSNPVPKNGGRDCFGEKREIQACFGTCSVCSDTLGKCYSVFPSLSVWNHARYDCWKRQMELVSIFSIEELRFIKTLLRERRFIDGHTTNSLFNVSFYAHIGLRMENPDKEYIPVWESQVLAHFLAWKPGEPSTRSCTRMNFQSFTEDKTWESIDCGVDLAEYFVCERQQKGTHIALSTSNVVYKQTQIEVNTTYTGKVCQRWDQTYPHQHDIDTGDLSKEYFGPVRDNYCRDVWGNSYLWCYTRDQSTRWEACHVRDDITLTRECKIDIYNIGRNNLTTSGKMCLSWNISYDDKFNSIDPVPSGDYCRDPFNDGYSWCYVNTSLASTHVSREICEIEDYIRRKGNAESPHRMYNENETIGFHCDNGKTVPYYAKCNGRFDCKDLTDENRCHRNYSAHQLLPPFNESENVASSDVIGMFFVCTTNERINIIAMCDRVIDCFDSSDETECYYLSDDKMLQSEHTSCRRRDQFQCDDGDCIHISQVCDFIPDCVDASDEYCEHDVCSSSEYKCDNGECIPSQLRCDAIKQCVDESDEDNCDICQPYAAFHCDILRCIPKRLICDNYMDCEDGSDERFCGNEVYSSCREWWNAGYRRNGKYIIEGIQVKCNFDDYEVYDKTYTVFDALDIHGIDMQIVGNNLEMKDDIRYLHKLYDCTQQVKVDCEYSLRQNYDARFDQCHCAIYTYNPAIGHFNQLKEHSEPCADIMVENRSISMYSYSPHRCVAYRIYSDYRTVGYQASSCKQIQIGPAVCNDSKIENFNCPINTVKCPDSFCLPVRFVCDGNIHCESGHDEDNCGCISSQNEVIILYEDGTVEDSLITQFSRQFYTPNSIVRILSFKASKPLKSFDLDSTQILVTDKQIDQRGDTGRLPECSYKIMSKDFLKSVKFTKNGTKGLIYIQNSLTSKEVADEIFANLDDLLEDYKLYRVTQDLNTDYDSQSVVSNVIPVRVRRWKTLTAVGAEYFSALCKVNSKVHCQGQYKCASSKTCIPLEQVCDGYRHCVHGDDELLCGFECPKMCFCNGLTATCRASDITVSDINNIPNTIRGLDLSLNNRLNSVLQQPVLDFMVLSVLNMSVCDVKVLSRYAFNRLRNLQLLDLSYNLITILQDRVFSSLTQLKTLHIHGNYYLSKIDPYAFQNLFHIRDLNLANSLLTRISANTFAGLKLKSIDLSNNRLEEIEPFSFSNLSVNVINFDGNTIKQFNKDIFTGVIDLKLLRTPSFKFCCIRPNYVDEHNCFPAQDEFSSCEDLMRHSVLQFLLWLIGVLALIGNCFSLIYRLKVDRKRLKLGYGIFVTNLAAADLLMGVYLLIIAIADASFRKRYIYVDDSWRGSFWCNLAGVLSTISSECSIFFLCLITLDRLLVIKFPFGTKYFTTKKSVTCVILAWLISSFIAILPIVYEGYFKNKFYSRSGVCLALPLTRDRPPGWVYSVLIFVALNFITFLLVAVGQWSIFYEFKKSTGMATTAQSSRKRDLKVARNLLLVVATDFMCWFPIGVMGVIALSGHAISGDVYAWTAVFILPVNSALNPILYTLTAIIGGKNFRPSTNEHFRAEMVKEIGDGVLKFHTVSRRLTHKDDLQSSKFWSVYKISVEEIDIPLVVILRSASHIAELLEVFHANCLGIKSLDVRSVLIRVSKRKVTGDVKIEAEPYVSVKPEDKTDDIYRYGLLLRNIGSLAHRHL